MSDEQDGRTPDPDEVQAAAQQGKHICPACGDWLPLELHEFRCAGKGHHYAVSRTSIYPAGPEGPADRVLREEVARDKHRGWVKMLGDAVLVVFVLVMLALLISALRNL